MNVFDDGAIRAERGKDSAPRPRRRWHEELGAERAATDQTDPWRRTEDAKA